MASTTSHERAVYLSSRRDATHVRNRSNAINNNANGGSGSRRRKAEPRSNGTIKSKSKSSFLSKEVLSCISVAMIILIVLLMGYTNLNNNESDSQSTSLGLYATWEEAPSSIHEFDHDNDKTVCRLPIITVEEWETGRYWEREVPVIVKNVTDAWPALKHWTK